MPILFAVGLINMMGFGLVIPLFPLFKVKFGLLDTEVGYTASVFAIAMIIGSLVFGALSDKIGRKINLYVPLFMASISYFLTSFVETFSSLLLLRAMTGFFCGCFSVSYAAVSDISTPENRLKKIGLIGIANGLGFVIGPALGGYLAGSSSDVSQINFHLPFLIASVFSLLAAVTAVLLFKETLPPSERKTEEGDSIMKQVKELFQNKVVVFFTTLNVTLASIMSGFQVFAAIWLHDLLNFSPSQIGLYWSAFAIVLGLVQTIIIPRIKNIKNGIVISFILYAIGFITLIFVNSTLTLIIPTTLMAIAVSILMPSINTGISLSGKKNQQGLIFGITQSIASFGRIIGPLVIGYMYHLSHNIAWLFLAISSIILAFVSFKKM